MASADDVFTAVQTALAATNVRVSVPGDLPTPLGAYPNYKLRLEAETKQSMGRNSLGFTTLVTVRVVGEVSEPVSTDDDVAMSEIVAKLTGQKRLAERAIINSYPLFRIVQQLVSVVTQFSYSMPDTRLGGIQSDYTFEIYEDADDFAPIAAEDLLTINAGLLTGPGFDATLPQ